MFHNVLLIALQSSDLQGETADGDAVLTCRPILLYEIAQPGCGVVSSDLLIARPVMVSSAQLSSATTTIVKDILLYLSFRISFLV